MIKKIDHNRLRITQWMNINDGRLQKTGYLGHIQYLTNAQWLEKEKDRFKKMGIGTITRENPRNPNVKALFYISIADLPNR